MRERCAHVRDRLAMSTCRCVNRPLRVCTLRSASIFPGKSLGGSIFWHWFILLSFAALLCERLTARYELRIDHSSRQVLPIPSSFGSVIWRRPQPVAHVAKWAKRVRKQNQSVIYCRSVLNGRGITTEMRLISHWNVLEDLSSLFCLRTKRPAAHLASSQYLRFRTM